MTDDRTDEAGALGCLTEKTVTPNTPECIPKSQARERFCPTRDRLFQRGQTEALVSNVMTVRAEGVQMESTLVPGSAPSGQELLPCPRGTDSLLENFVRIVLPPPEASVVLRGFYTEALHAVLLMRLAALRESEIDDQGGGVRALSKWRLRRVYEFVDTNLERRISLQMLAGAAGISRMYFAAQFRAATGLRPHSYVTRRRVEHAKVLLAKPGSSIVDIAFSVGFQTQSHFTTVFKRLEGVTPHRWRELHGVGGSGLTAICKDYARGGAQPRLA